MYKLLVYSDELYHYGVLGMRWGVRRYQDYKGHRIKGDPVTSQRHAGHPQKLRDTVVGGQGGKAKGTEKIAANASNKPSAKDVAQKLATPSVKQGKGREDISPAEDITKKAKRVAESGERIAEFGEKHDKSVQQKNEEARQKQMNKAKKMSDKELRDSINRIKMEREYTSLTTKEVESGWTKAKDILSVSKEVLEITGAIVGIIASIMAIKKGLGMKQSGIFTKAFLNEQLSVENLPEDVLIHAMDLDEQYLMAAYDISEEDVQDYIKHHGIKGMKWGVRRYQNYDGTRISTGTPNLPKPSLLGRGVGSGAGGGGGGSKKSSNPFRNSIAGGQGGNATGNARLAATAGIKVKEGNPSNNKSKYTKFDYDNMYMDVLKNKDGHYVITDGHDSMTISPEVKSAIEDLVVAEVYQTVGFKSVKELDSYLDTAGAEERKYFNNIVNEYLDLKYMEILDKAYAH